MPHYSEIFTDILLSSNPLDDFGFSVQSFQVLSRSASTGLANEEPKLYVGVSVTMFVCM